MRLNYIELRNYRKFERIRLEFPDGLIGVLGNNGVGKSTLVESISWALFGNQKEIVRVGKESIRRSNAPDNESTFAKLEYRFAGDEYIVTREMGGKSLSMDAKLLINGKIVATGANEVTSYIQDKLGMDYKSFFISVFARQKELNALSSLTERERRITIVRMLGIDQLDDVIDNISKYERSTRDRTSDLRSLLIDEDGQPKSKTLESRRTELEKEGAVLSKEIESMRERQSKLKWEEKDNEDKLNALSEKLRGLREAQKLLEKDKRLRDSRKERRDQLEREITEARKAAEEASSLPELNSEYETLKKETELQISNKSKAERLKEIEGEIESIDQEIAENGDEIEKLKEAVEKAASIKKKTEKTVEMIEAAEKELVDLRNEKSKLDQQMISIKENLKSERDHLSQIEKLGPESVCPTCERSLGDHYEHLMSKMSSSMETSEKKIEELRIAKEAAESDINDRTRKTEALKKRQEAIKREEMALQQAEQSMEAVRKNIEKTSRRREKLVSQMESIGEIEFDFGKLSSLQSKLRETEKRRDNLIGLSTIAGKLPELEKTFEEIETELKKMKEKIDSMRIDTDEMKKLEASENELVEKRKEHKKKSEETYESIVGLTAKKESISAELQSIERERKSLREIEAQLSSIEDKQQSSSKLLEIMKEFRKGLISRIIPTLSQVATDLIAQLTEGKYSALTLDEGYNIFLEDNGENHKLERFSGGETDLANLCLRLAISKVISERAGTEGMSFIVLDEIFGSQDAFRKRNLLSAFNALSRQFRQIFLITHIDEIKDSLSSIIEVYEDERGVSHAKLTA